MFVKQPLCPAFSCTKADRELDTLYAKHVSIWLKSIRENSPVTYLFPNSLTHENDSPLHK